MTPLVHLYESVSALHCFQFGAEITRRAAANIPEIEVVGSTNEDRWIFFRRVFGTIDIGRHAFTVAHRNHQLAFDDCNRLKFSFDSVSAGDHFRSCSAPTLGAGSLLESALNGDSETCDYGYHHPEHLHSHGFLLQVA